MKDAPTNRDKLNPSHNPAYLFIFIGVVLVMLIGLAFVLPIVFGSDTARPNSPVSIAGFSSEYMSPEQRASDVSEWVKDVADNMKVSDERSTFADTVSNYTNDGEIDAGEYDALFRVYGVLKAKSYADIIDEGLIKIRGAETNPEPETEFDQTNTIIE